MMTSKEFIKRLKIANKMKTLYVLGGFGSPAGYGSNRQRFANNNEYNKSRVRKKKIINAGDECFFFDCVGLGKAILWGWDADPSQNYGGAKYKTNKVPDFSADQSMKYCSGVTTVMKNIEPGEWVWLPGHVGYYIGDGEVIECTPKWRDGVQVTKLKARAWQKHGKLKFIDYGKETKGEKDFEKIARDVIAGKYGDGEERKKRLGKDYAKVQKIVNNLIK